MADKNLAVGLVAAAIIGAGAIGFVVLSNKKESNNVDQTVTENNRPTNTSTTQAYKNGTYSAEGEYISPGGLESVLVSVVLDNGVVKSVEFTSQAEDQNSKQYQELFASGYESRVVGKKIDDVLLDKVSGSSLTSKGFMDALNKIKAEARS